MFRRYYEGPRTIRLGYDFYADIAERIVEKRKEAKLTQAQLAEKSKLPVGKIIKYECVKIRCSLDDLDKISSSLGVSTDYLIGAEYDDPDCDECLYTVWNERFETENDRFVLFFKASSPQMAFLRAHKWSLENKLIWFEARDRARVRLEGAPVRKTDYKRLLRERKSDYEDEIELA